MTGFPVFANILEFIDSINIIVVWNLSFAETYCT